MKDLIYIALGGYPLHTIEPERVSRVRNSALAEYLLEKSKDSEWLARMTIKMLDLIALDPLAGRPQPLPARGESPALTNYIAGYVDGSSRSEDEAPYFVTAHLHTVGNPFGYFTLNRNSPLVSELVEAVQKNLAGKRFKAALMYRRTTSLASRISARIERKGSAARNLAYQKAYAENAPANGSSYRTKEQLERANEAGTQAFFEATDIPIHTLHERRYRITNASMDDTFRGSYTDACLGLLEQFILPEFEALQQETATA